MNKPDIRLVKHHDFCIANGTDNHGFNEECTGNMFISIASLTEFLKDRIRLNEEIMNDENCADYQHDNLSWERSGFREVLKWLNQQTEGNK